MTYHREKLHCRSIPSRNSWRRFWPKAFPPQSKNRFVLLALIAFLLPGKSFSDEPRPRINLEDDGLYQLSQRDPHWAAYRAGVSGLVYMAQAGCVPTSVAMIANYHRLISKFPVFRFYLVTSKGIRTVQAKRSGFPDEVTPAEIHEIFSKNGDYTPFGHLPNGNIAWCEACFRWDQATDNGFFDPAGFTIGLQLVKVPNTGRDLVDIYLKARQPSILILKNVDPKRPLGTHAVVVAGWDPDTSSYLILDPWDAPGSRAKPIKDKWRNWETKIDYFVLANTTTERTSSIDVTIQSPVEVLVFDPAGRKAGFDPSTGVEIAEIPESSYSLQSWADLTGLSPPEEPAKILEIGSPADGVYRLYFIGTGNGPFTIQVRAHYPGGALAFDQILSGNIVAGQVLMYQLSYSGTAPILFSEGSNFSPQAKAGGDRTARINTPLEFDARASFDIDGQIASYHWDFGDGSTRTGSQVSYSYAAPGAYTVRLTVTDDQGAIGADTAVVGVIGGQQGITERVSVSSTGAEGYGRMGSFNPSISADGRFVAFESWANNLVTGDINNSPDVFVKDRQSGRTELINNISDNTVICSPGSFSGGRDPSISADGRFVAFVASQCNLIDRFARGTSRILLRDRLTGALEEVDVSSTGQPAFVDPNFFCTNDFGGCGSFSPSISADGRYVAFQSDAPNLVPNDTNQSSDIFVRDRIANSTERISVSNTGTQVDLASTYPSISADGRFVFFGSKGSVVDANLGRLNSIYVRDRVAGVTTKVAGITDDPIPCGPTCTAASAGRHSSTSADGRFVAFESSTCSTVTCVPAIFVRDRQQRAYELISVSSTGGAPNNDSRDPSISSDGRFVAFRSRASNLVPVDNGFIEDVFIRDRVTGRTELVSISTTGDLGNGSSGGGQNLADPTKIGITADGSIVAFTSQANNLVPSDFNGLADIFVRRRASTKPAANPSGPYVGWASSSETPAFVNFNGRQSLDPNGAALTARWDFGDGSPQVVAGVTAVVPHIYASEGDYTVTLIVNNGREDSAPATSIARIFPSLKRKAVSLLPSCGDPGTALSVLIENNPLVSPAGGWDLGIGDLPSIESVHPDLQVPLWFQGPASGDLGNQMVPIESLRNSSSPLEFAIGLKPITVPGWKPGIYSVTASGEGVPSASFSVPCPPLANYPPIAVVGGPYVGSVNAPISFDGSRSSDPEGAPLTYSWFFGDSETSTLGNATPTHIYTEPGIYFVSLEVFDGQLRSTPRVGSVTRVTVEEAPRDTIAPTTTASPSPSPNANGWNNSEVTIALNALDDPGGSGIKTIHYSLSGAESRANSALGSSATVTITAEGTTVLTYFAKDLEGNQEAAKTLTVRIDKTAPTVTCAISPSPNANGWNNTNVTVGFTATDTISGINLTPQAVVITTEGADQFVTGNAKDKAGNLGSVTCRVNIDKTPPVIAGLPASGCTLWPPNHKLVEIASIRATDGISGLAPGGLTIRGTSSEPENELGDGDTAPDIVINGGTVQLRAERYGTGNGRVYTLNVTGTDVAGNSANRTATCTVPHDQRDRK